MRRSHFSLISLSFFTIILIPCIFSYELKCDIDVIPLDPIGLVETGDFRPNITFVNIGEKSFPSSAINVTIFNPNQEILESHYTYVFDLPDLNINQSFSYSKPFFYKNLPKWYSAYELTTPGTWEIRINILNLPKDDITYTRSNLVRTNGECRKYFYVKNMDTYEREKLDRIAQERSDELQRRTESLNIAVLFLTFLTAIKLFADWGVKYKNIVIGIEGIIIAIIFVQTQPDSILVFITSVILFVTSVFALFKNKLIKTTRLKILYFASLIVILLFNVFILLYSFDIFRNDYFMLTIGLTVSIISISAVISEFLEIRPTK